MFIVIIKPILVFVSQGFIFYFLKEECIMALGMNSSPKKIGEILDVVNSASPAEIRDFLQEKTGLTASDDEIKRALDFLNKHRAKPLTDSDLESAAGGVSKGGKIAIITGAILGTVVTIGAIKYGYDKYKKSGQTGAVTTRSAGTVTTRSAGTGSQSSTSTKTEKLTESGSQSSTRTKTEKLADSGSQSSTGAEKQTPVLLDYDGRKPILMGHGRDVSVQTETEYADTEIQTEEKQPGLFSRFRNFLGWG